MGGEGKEGAGYDEGVGGGGRGEGFWMAGEGGGVQGVQGKMKVGDEGGRGEGASQSLDGWVADGWDGAQGKMKAGEGGEGGGGHEGEGVEGGLPSLWMAE